LLVVIWQLAFACCFSVCDVSLLRTNTKDFSFYLRLPGWRFLIFTVFLPIENPLFSLSKLGLLVGASSVEDPNEDEPKFKFDFGRKVSLSEPKLDLLSLLEEPKLPKLD